MPLDSSMHGVRLIKVGPNGAGVAALPIADDVDALELERTVPSAGNVARRASVDLVAHVVAFAARWEASDPDEFDREAFDRELVALRRQGRRLGHDVDATLRVVVRAAAACLADDVRQLARAYPLLPVGERRGVYRVLRGRGHRLFNVSGYELVFNVAGFLKDLLLADDPDGVPNPEGAGPLSEEEVAQFMAVHAACNPDATDEDLGFLEFDLKAPPGAEPPRDQFERRAARMEARSKQPGQQWVAPFARRMRARAERECASTLRAQSVRTVVSVATRRVRSRESSPPPSSRSRTTTLSGRDPPRRSRPSAGSASGDDENDAEHVAASEAAVARSGGAR
jgi:hypothetical protein